MNARDLAPCLHGSCLQFSMVGGWNMGLSQIFLVNRLLTLAGEILASNLWSEPVILNTIAEKLKLRSKDDFKGRHFGFCCNGTVKLSAD
ncbi:MULTISPECIES: hypothetical protein [Mesorhizobium]|uniref:hypothetical protein n=1 Tax=Mesorhizobium TaxID=68287 RepID=UPI00115F9DE8|nr:MULTISPECIES: hypothetical protein [Mesorhizobium]AID34783.2 hypothetical protein MCHK_8193 [Mesorhizobium huakuii 7653R]MCH4561355.1 hypothetical protein [Mesorhizobium jarvisii]